MKYILLGASLALLPVAASAQSVTLSGGVAVATSYDLTADTGTEADYPLSFYMQADANGFYGQLWFGTLPAAAAPDQVEIDVILGYGTELSSGVGLDLSYAAYFFDDTGFNSSEVIGAVSYGLTDKLSGSFQISYQIEAETSDYELGLDYAITDMWSVQGLVGFETAGDSTYYELGVTYAVTDEVAFNVLYEDDDIPGNDGLLTFTMSYDFTVGQ